MDDQIFYNLATAEVFFWSHGATEADVTESF